MHKLPEIKLLADCDHLIPELANLWHKELGQKYVPHITLDLAVERFKSHLNHMQLPLTYVAMMNDQPIGMASLRITDGILPELTPWLGSLVVNRNYRSTGVGKLLVERIEFHAKSLNYQKLYLFTFDVTLPNWYAKLGWRTLAGAMAFEHPVTVMSKRL